MRRDRRDEVRRNAHVETLAERITFSVQPFVDALPDPAPVAEQFGQLDAAPDFVLDESLSAEAATQLTPLLDEAHEITGVREVHQLGLDGSGQTVVIIDSGVAWDHEALGGGFGASYQVVGGWDFAENDANPYDDGPRGFHGTHVAGIIGSNDRFDTGVAPGVDLVALRVFSDQGEGVFQWVEDALQWVHENKDSFENPVTTVNLSLGAAWNADTVPEWAMLEEELAQLEQDGIFISVAAGNSFGAYNDPGLSYPAVSPHVVPVASVTDNDVLSSFSQRSSRALLAPGQSIMSTIPDHATTAKDGRVNDFGVASGTSMAAPYVAGSAVLVRQAMELAGYQNITQDTIYDHLRATADPVYDAVTNATYFRIDVLAAVQALQGPGDDYGDTASTAEQLGTVSGGRTVSGSIGHAGDVDYFAFTAASSGSVTIGATTVGISPVWSLPGQAETAGGQLSFDVQAGQTYQFGIASAEGLGGYSLDVQLEHSQTRDLGRVELFQADQLSVAGESRYAVTADRAGVLAASVDGNLQVAIYRDGVRLASGAGQVQTAAAAGERFEVRVEGQSSSHSLTIANQVQVQGGSVTVHGVDGMDIVSLDNAAGQLQVNGITYSAEGRSITIYGGGGQDQLTVAGGRWYGRLGPSSSMLYGGGQTIYAMGFEQVDVSATSGSVALLGSQGADHVELSSGYAELSGEGYSLVARGFDNATALGLGGADTATLRGGAGNDTLHGWTSRAQLVTGGQRLTAVGFETVDVHAGGGNDRAYLFDSDGDDRFTAAEGRAVMEAGGVITTALGFERSYGVASGGFDRAIIEDSAGDDRFTAMPTQSYLSGDSYYVHARAFDRVDAQASHGGDDQATFHDSAGDDRFSAMPNYASMQGAGFQNNAQGFERMYGFAHNGGQDQALLYDGPQDDHLQVSGNGLQMSGDGYRLAAKRFETFRAYATSGGTDTGELTGQWQQWQQAGEQVTVSGPTAAGLTRGFDVQVHAIPVQAAVDATPLGVVQASGDDLARLPVVDSRGVDLRLTTQVRQAHQQVFADQAPALGDVDDAIDAIAADDSDDAQRRDAAFSDEFVDEL